MLKNSENNGMGEIGLVTPTPSFENYCMRTVRTLLYFAVVRYRLVTEGMNNNDPSVSGESLK